MGLKRVKMKLGTQRELIQKAKAKRSLSWNPLAKHLKLNSCYLSNELNNEERLLRSDIFEALCRLAGSNYSKHVETALDSNWGQVKGGTNSNAGGKGIIKIKKPKIDEKFAELIGAYLGDGTLTKYFMRITADKRYCFSYLEYLAKLAEESIGLKATIRIPSKRNIAFLEIRSKQFCDYLKTDLGLLFGDKIRNKLQVPKEILCNETLAIACLRGLMDTDGSVSKRGNQPCLEFASRNPALLEQVWGLGLRLELFTHRNKEQVGTNSWSKIVKYFNVVGSSNKIHIIRFCERFSNGKLLRKTELLTYFKKYDAIRIPFVGPWSSG